MTQPKCDHDRHFPSWDGKRRMGGFDLLGSDGLPRQQVEECGHVRRPAAPSPGPLNKEEL